MRINWDHIEDDKTFQRLVNHLMGLECPAVGFIPSSPYLGKDGGWDGMYEGLYPREDTEGRYSFQAKWTKYSHKEKRKEATKQLKQVLPEEIRKAQENNVQHLRIATNALLDVDNIEELESIDKGNLLSFKIWDGAALGLRIEKRPFLMHKYFNYPQHPLFLPWDLYCENYEPHLLPGSLDDISAFDSSLLEAERFLKDPGVQILLVHAPAGYGKSHLMREVAKLAPQLDQATEPMWARLPLRDLKDAIQNEIIADHNYLLIIDDADRSTEGIEALTALLPLNKGNIKVVLGTRSASKRLVEDAITGSGRTVSTHEIQIPDWSSADLIALLRASSATSPVEDEEEIVKSYRYPYLITWIGKNMVGKAKPASEMLKKLVKDLQNDAIKAAGGVIEDEYTIKRALLHLSLIVPFRPESNSKEIDILSQELDIPKDRLYTLVKQWTDAGILRNVGYTCRFSPDLKGEFFLNQEVSQLDEFAVAELIQSWLGNFAERVFGNLGSTYRLGEISAVESYLTKQIGDWIKDAATTTAFQRKENLELFESIAFAIPETAIDLIRTYLETPAPEPEDDYGLSKRYGPFTLSTDHFGPVILQLIKIGKVRNRVVKLILEIDALDIEGTYGNYRPGELIEGCVCPLENGKTYIVSTLKQLEDGPLELKKCAVKEVLSGTHEYRRSSGKTLTIGEKYLTRPDEAAAFRDEAINIVEKLLLSEESNEFEAGLEIASDIGQTRMGRRGMCDLPLIDRFKKEYNHIVQILQSLLDKGLSLIKRARIENFLLNLWALEKPAANDAAQILRDFQRTPEYLFVHYYFSPENTIEDFSSLETAASDHQDGRWSYFVWNVRAKKRKQDFTSYSGLLPKLIAQYQDNDTIIDFLKKSESELSGQDTTWSPTIVKYWVSENTQPFIAIRKNPSLWNQVPERFQIEIDLALSSIDPESLRIFLDEIHSTVLDATPRKCGLFLDIVIDTLPKDRVEEEMMFLIERRGVEFNRTILHSVFRVYKRTEDADLALRFVEAVIHQHDEITEAVVDGVAFVIHCLQEKDDLIEERKQLLRPLLIPSIACMEKISHDGNEILGALISDLDGFTQFIESRLKRAKERYEDSDYGFDLSPYKGIQSITTVIPDYLTFKKLILKFCEWYTCYHQLFRHDLFQMIKPLKTLRSNDNELYLKQAVLDLVGEGDLSRAFLVGEHLPFDGETTQVLIQLCEAGISGKKVQEVKTLLSHFTLPPEGWESEIGEPAPKLLEIVSSFKKLKKATQDGELHRILGECIDYVERLVESQLKNDKDEFDG